MKVYGIKSCDKVRAAMKALTSAGRAPELVDIREQPLQISDLEAFHSAFGDRRRADRCPSGAHEASGDRRWRAYEHRLGCRRSGRLALTVATPRESVNRQGTAAQ